MPESPRRLVSIVTPAYNEETNIAELARRLRGVFDAVPDYEFEVVIVENGSSDSTWERILEEHRSDQRFKGLKLSRNFEAEGGIAAGLQHVRGDAAVIMSADLQDPPELITSFIHEWEKGYDNVYLLSGGIEEFLLSHEDQVEGKNVPDLKRMKEEQDEYNKTMMSIQMKKNQSGKVGGP